jgi:hypothetical protein
MTCLARTLPHDTVVEFFYRYFTLGQSIQQVANATKVRRTLVEMRLRSARDAIGDMRSLAYSPDLEPKILADDAFCKRMRAAIERGVEQAPVGVCTTPSTEAPQPMVSATTVALTSSAGWD